MDISFQYAIWITIAVLLFGHRLFKIGSHLLKSASIFSLSEKLADAWSNLRSPEPEGFEVFRVVNVTRLILALRSVVSLVLVIILGSVVVAGTEFIPIHILRIQTSVLLVATALEAFQLTNRRINVAFAMIYFVHLWNKGNNEATMLVVHGASRTLFFTVLNVVWMKAHFTIPLTGLSALLSCWLFYGELSKPAVPGASINFTPSLVAVLCASEVLYWFLNSILCVAMEVAFNAIIKEQDISSQKTVQLETALDDLTQTSSELFSQRLALKRWATAAESSPEPLPFCQQSCSEVSWAITSDTASNTGTAVADDRLETASVSGALLDTIDEARGSEDASTQTTEPEKVVAEVQVSLMPSAVGKPPSLPDTTAPPPMPAWRIGDRISDSSVDSKQQVAPNGMRILVETLPQTSKAMRQRSLLATMRQWNICFSSQVCCPYHASIKRCQDALANLRNNRCNPLWSSFSDWSCSHCSTANPLGEFCTACRRPAVWQGGIGPFLLFDPLPEPESAELIIEAESGNIVNCSDSFAKLFPNISIGTEGDRLIPYAQNRTFWHLVQDGCMVYMETDKLITFDSFVVIDTQDFKYGASCTVTFSEEEIVPADCGPDDNENDPHGGDIAEADANGERTERGGDLGEAKDENAEKAECENLEEAEGENAEEAEGKKVEEGEDKQAEAEFEYGEQNEDDEEGHEEDYGEEGEGGEEEEDFEEDEEEEKFTIQARIVLTGIRKIKKCDICNVGLCKLLRDKCALCMSENAGSQ